MNEKSPSSPLKVLLIEDNEHDRIAFQRALKVEQPYWEIAEVDRAEEVLERLKVTPTPFDVLVIDYDLPGMDGLSFFKSLKSGGQDDLPPCVMLTGAGTELVAVEALKAGMYDYIVKDPNQGYLRLIPLILKSVVERYYDRRERLEAKAQLKKAHRELEKRVEARTAELSLTVQALEREIEERKVAVQALRRSEQRLRELSRQILAAQENERKIAAREIHDAVSGNLATIKFSLEEKLERMADEPPSGEMSLEKIIALVKETIQETRRICANLRPSMLDDLGLLKTLEWFCREYEKYYPHIRIERRFEISETDIDPSLQNTVYRVLQEAMNNVAKHSGADSIQINLARLGERIELCVTDNGCGFDPASLGARTDSLSGYGLAGMTDRAEICGGSLDIASAAGDGTALRLTLPLDINPAAEDN
jgi:signal transduction histidine kinase